MFNPDQDLPRVEDTGKRDEPASELVRDVPLCDELRARIRHLDDPRGQRTDDEGEVW